MCAVPVLQQAACATCVHAPSIEAHSPHPFLFGPQFHFNQGPEWNLAFTWANVAFTAIFLLEMLLK